MPTLESSGRVYTVYTLSIAFYKKESNVDNVDRNRSNTPNLLCVLGLTSALLTCQVVITIVKGRVALLISHGQFFRIEDVHSHQTYIQISTYKFKIKVQSDHLPSSHALGGVFHSVAQRMGSSSSNMSCDIMFCV